MFNDRKNKNNKDDQQLKAISKNRSLSFTLSKAPNF